MPYDSPSVPTASPITEVVVDPHTQQVQDRYLMVSRDWIQWFFAILGQLDRSTKVLGSSSVPPITNAALPPTPINLPNLPPGLYRLTYYARITRPGTISSTLQVILRWVEGGIQQAYAGPPMTANTTQTTQAGSVLIKADGGTPMGYQTNYASDAPATMTYSLDVTVESVIA